MGTYDNNWQNLSEQFRTVSEPLRNPHKPIEILRICFTKTYNKNQQDSPSIPPYPGNPWELPKDPPKPWEALYKMGNQFVFHPQNNHL